MNASSFYLKNDITTMLKHVQDYYNKGIPHKDKQRLLGWKQNGNVDGVRDEGKCRKKR